jgi:hypothetical protein
MHPSWVALAYRAILPNPVAGATEMPSTEGQSSSRLIRCVAHAKIGSPTVGIFPRPKSDASRIGIVDQNEVYKIELKTGICP